MKLEDYLNHVASGAMSPADAAAAMKKEAFRDLGFARIDVDRSRRRAFPEVIYCPNKTTEQVVHIVGVLKQTGEAVLATRAEPKVFDAVKAVHPDAIYHHLARCITVAAREPKPRTGLIAVVAAGTGDLPVAEEAAITAEWAGVNVTRVFDCGVAGLHRLMPHIETLRTCRVVICVAGMEGALPSVLGGLIDRPLIAVPTSVGYGVNLGGLAALMAMLNSCAAGVSVCNIDNGFGAGIAAALINRMVEEQRA